MEVITYEYIKTGANEFRFVTDNNNMYFVNFVKYWQEDVVRFISGIEINVFELYFEVENKLSNGFDNKIAPTIFRMLELYFSFDNTVVYFVTQRNDGRSSQLFRVYQLWHKLYKKSGRAFSDKILKSDRFVDSDGQTDAFVSCMTHVDHFDEKIDFDKLTDFVLVEIFPNSTIRKA